MNTPPIRIVLDSTTIAAYAAGSIAVGELIAEVGDDGARIGVPLACLVEAYRCVRDDHLPTVALLAEHPAVVVTDGDPADWLAFAGLVRDLGRADPAAALLLAVDEDGDVLTCSPERYGDWKDLPIIAI